MSSPQDSSAERSLSEAAIKALLDSIKFKEIPIPTESSEELHTGDIFKKGKLRNFLLLIIVDLTNGSFNNDKFLLYLTKFNECLRKEKKLSKILGTNKAKTFTKSLANVISYFEGADVDISHYEEVYTVPLLGPIFKHYVDMENLSVFVNAVIKKKPIDKDLVIDCINFLPLISDTGTLEELKCMNNGIREIVFQVCTYLENPTMNLKSLLSIMGEIRRARKESLGGAE